MASDTNPGLFRYGGMYGAAYRAGELLSEVIEVNGNSEINRIEVPIVGSTKQGYKPGREARDGTLRLQKVDTKWEMEVYQFLSASLQLRRWNRDHGRSNLRPFNIELEYDDPDAVGIEKWQLAGCLIWRLPLGFSITDDTVEREYPLTWESETPIYAFRAVRTTTAAGTVITPSWYTAAPTPTSWPGPGAEPATIP